MHVSSQQAPVGAVLAVAAVGLLVVPTADWEPGVVVVGLALLLGAGLRAGLPTRAAGWLVVRSRAFDTAVLLVLGFGLLLLATSIPEA